MTQPATANNQSQQQSPASSQQQARAAQLGTPQTEYFWKVHSYTNEYIRFADTKAAAVIAWAAALIGALFSLKAHQRFMQGMTFSNVNLGATLLGAASLAAFLFLCLAAAAAFGCVKPRLRSKFSGKGHDKGYLYLGQVREHTDAAEFKEGLARQTPEQLAAHCADHVYMLADIARWKYGFVDWAILLAIPGSVLAAVVALFAQ